jgi:large subunit ribosomal protein L22
MSKTSEKQNTPKVVTAYARDLHIAPRKMRLVTNLVKNMYALDAVAQLSHSTKKAAPMVVKLLKSAIANAQHNFSIEPEALYIKSITTDQGKVMKRYFPRARGSAFVIRRKMCHVNVELEQKKAKTTTSSRMQLLKKLVKPTEGKEDQKKVKDMETGKVEQSAAERKPDAPKSSEQVKANKIQNKRRLFNRKTGE